MKTFLAGLLATSLLLCLLIAAGCSNPLETDPDPVLIIRTDTLMIIDTLVTIDTILIVDSLISPPDTILIIDSIYVTDTIFVEVPQPEGDGCSAGKPRILTMRYTGEGCDASQHNQGSDKVQCSGTPGPGSVMIKVTDKTDPDDSRAMVFFDGGPIAVGDTFDIDASFAGADKLKSNTVVHIYQNGAVVQTVRFHTSCSRPLSVGDQFGSLVLEVFVAEL